MNEGPFDVMSAVVPALGTAFAATAVWLTVRIVNRKNKPGWRFWTTVTLLTLLTAYPLSIGPFIWLAYHNYLPLDNECIHSIARLYAPIAMAARQSTTVSSALDRYAKSWIGCGVHWDALTDR